MTETCPDTASSALPEDKPEAGPERRAGLRTAVLTPGLYLVGTPIGNLEDITLRALRVLGGVDRIACEDTRVTQKLLNHFGIRVPTVSCHEHNERARTVELLQLIENGGRVAVVSDAGMPGISDPGMLLARAAIEAGVPVIPVPGPSALLTALVASGFDTGQFFYGGFLQAKAGSRRRQLEELSMCMRGSTATLIFYEAPHRILGALEDVERVWGAGVRVAVGRELTKLHEEFLRGSAAEIRAQLASRERIRGEIVLLIEPAEGKEGGTRGSTASARSAQPDTSGPASAQPESSIARRVAQLMRDENLDSKDALKRVARERSLSKSAVYREWQREKR